MNFTFTLGAILLACLIVNIEAAATDKPVTTKPAEASKDVKDAIKAAKEAKKAKEACMKFCSANYEPVCAHDPTNPTFKPRSFGNQCALDNHNCEMGTKLVVKTKGECPGAAGIQL